MRPWKTLAARLFLSYLRSFPLRDGKAWLYSRLHRKMAPAAGWVILPVRRGFALRLDLADPDQRRLYFFGDYEERREADLIQETLAPGESFWDVGANIGYFTLLAAAVLHNTGQVAAFEPSRPAFDCLQANVRLNAFTNVRLCKAAVSDQEGRAILYRTPASADGRANLFRPGLGQEETELVTTLTLDGWRRAHNQAGPHFLKIDVEGSELAVLRGARKTLETGEPLLLVEIKEAVCRQLGCDRRAFQEFLQPLGYQPFGLLRGRWRRFPDLTRIRSRNVLFLKPDLPWHRLKAREAGIRM